MISVKINIDPRYVKYLHVDCTTNGKAENTTAMQIQHVSRKFDRIVFHYTRIIET